MQDKPEQPEPPREQQLDEALADTFPASDPVVLDDTSHRRD